MMACTKTEALLFLFSGVAWAAAASAQQRAIDTKKSVMTVHVYRTGIFSAFAHDHEIAAPIAGGSADVAGRSVEVRTHASAWRVVDAKASEKDREKIQKTMLGAEVLDVERHPEIVFRSTAVEPISSASWKVRGNLTLHGQTRPITVNVSERNAHYAGLALVKQTDFGMKPVRIAGGTVRVKDEVRIEFDIQLAR